MKDYNQLALAVACEYDRCRAAVGEPCRGASGYTQSTHSVRRQAASRARRELAARVDRLTVEEKPMKLKMQMTMILEFDGSVPAADLGRAREAAKEAFEKHGFKVSGLRLTPIDGQTEKLDPAHEGRSWAPEMRAARERGDR